MGTKKCPGQSKQYWKPDDIFYVNCIHCNTEIEFWKDDVYRSCPSCKKKNFNPRLKLGCIQWCKYAEECVGEEDYKRIINELNNGKKE